ncbi:MAG: flavin-containing monooxygenase [Acidimicrobiales bacterium]
MGTHSDSVIIIGGGQSGLAAARAASHAGLRPLVLETGERPVGSWPRYYDSLKLFSPVRFNSFPDMAFLGEADHYPTRDEVARHLERYAQSLGVEIRTKTHVEAVEAAGSGFVVHTSAGDRLHAAGLVAASGSFSNPYMPELPGLARFTGELLHVADYGNPAPYAGKRVVIVGGGNSAVQVGYELAQVSVTTIATLEPLLFVDQRPGGRDLHYALASSGFDDLPPEWLGRIIRGIPVLDTGVYRDAVESGLMDRRPVFTELDGKDVIWADGDREPVDVVLCATGYRPSLGYLRSLGALDPDGMPLHVGGVSTTHPGLVYVGLEFQRSFASNTLRGVHRDARHVVGPLAAHVRGAATVLGLPS